jgi:hypothetical protein
MGLQHRPFGSDQVANQRRKHRGQIGPLTP